MTELPPPPGGGKTRETPPRRKSLAEKLVSGVLSAAPILALAALAALILYGIFSGPVTRDYSTGTPGPKPPAVVQQAEVQDHVNRVLRIVQAGNTQEATAVSTAFRAEMEQRGCATIGTINTAPNPRTAGAAIDGFIEHAKAVPEGFSAAVIGYDVVGWPATKDPRDVVYLAVAVACQEAP